MSIKNCISRISRNILIVSTAMGALGFWCIDWASADLYAKKMAADMFQNMSYQEVIAEIDTPKEVQWYIDNYIRPSDEYRKVTNSFKVTHEIRKGDCSEAFVAAAALLSDDGYPPVYLYLRNQSVDINHVVLLYQVDGKFGTVGTGLGDYLPPIYTTPEEIAKKLGFDYYRPSLIYDGEISDWISSEKDLYGEGHIFKKRDAEDVPALFEKG